MSLPSVLSLSLCNVCCAKCPWCPIGRGIYKHRDNRFMPMEVIDRIITGSPPVRWREIWFSENGEGLLHPNFRDIVEKLEAVYFETPFCLATNFALLTPEMSKYLLQHGFEWISGNIDGSTQETYGAVKGLRLDNALKNLEGLLAAANNINPGAHIGVNILTLSYFNNAMGITGGPDLVDDTIQTFKMLRDLFESYNRPVTFFIPVPLTWAYREELKIPKLDKSCAGKDSLDKKFYVDADGNVYPCCLDYNSDYVYGNVLEESVPAIWYGKRRKRFIRLVGESKWGEIGDPCRWCQD